MAHAIASSAGSTTALSYTLERNADPPYCTRTRTRFPRLLRTCEGRRHNSRPRLTSFQGRKASWPRCRVSTTLLSVKSKYKRLLRLGATKLPRIFPSRRARRETTKQPQPRCEIPRHQLPIPYIRTRNNTEGPFQTEVHSNVRLHYGKAAPCEKYNSQGLIFKLATARARNDAHIRSSTA